METIKFKPLFLIYVFLCVYFGWYNNIFFYIIAVVLHEYGHLLVAKFLGYKSNGIVFDLYGAGLKNNNYFARKDDIVISFAGPFVNLLLILLIVCFWWIIPSSYSLTYEFFVCNLYVMIFNLLPIYPLDAGRVIVALFGAKFRKKNILKVSAIICFIIGLLFLILFIVSLFFVINLNMLFIGIFLVINGVLGLQNLKYESIKALCHKKINNCEVKLWNVESFEKIKLLRLISREYYSIFVMYKEGKRFLKYEDELFN